MHRGKSSHLRCVHQSQPCKRDNPIGRPPPVLKRSLSEKLACITAYNENSRSSCVTSTDSRSLGIRAILHKDDVSLKIKRKHFRGAQTVKYIEIYNASNSLIGFARTQPLSAEKYYFYETQMLSVYNKTLSSGASPGFSSWPRPLHLNNCFVMSPKPN